MYNSESHYAALANSYDEHWLYSEQYVQTMATAITECLELVDTDQLADIGCGTGIYARAIDQMIGFRQPIQCVDPSGPMLKQLQASNRFHTIEKDAIAFLESSHTANKYLIKEAVHHIDDKERLFKAIRSSLGPKDVFLILLLPPTIEYPLFRAALDRYEERQPHYNDLIAMAESHGLSTQSAIISIPLRIEKAKYLQMVKGRYMSLLSTFTDAETAAGIQEIDRTYPETVLDFPDRFVFLCMTLGSHEQ